MILILGGPLVISRGSNDDIANTAVVIGIVSFSRIDCSKDPGVYTRVSKFLPRIQSFL